MPTHQLVAHRALPQPASESASAIALLTRVPPVPASTGAIFLDSTGRRRRRLAGLFVVAGVLAVAFLCSVGAVLPGAPGLHRLRIPVTTIRTAPAGAGLRESPTGLLYLVRLPVDGDGLVTAAPQHRAP
jgi:hypothetical protein